MIHQPPMQPSPPPNLMYAQVFQDPGHTFDVVPNIQNQGYITANNQRPVDTLTIHNFLTSKFIGITSTITNSDRRGIARAVVTQVIKDETGYTCLMYDPQSREQVEVKVIFEGFIQNPPTQKRWAMSVASQIQQKRLKLDTQKQ